MSYDAEFLGHYRRENLSGSTITTSLPRRLRERPVQFERPGWTRTVFELDDCQVFPIPWNSKPL